MADTSGSKTKPFSLYLMAGDGTGPEGELAKLLGDNRRRQSLMRELIIMGFLVSKQGARLDASGQRIVGLDNPQQFAAGSGIQPVPPATPTPAPPAADTPGESAKQKYKGLA